MPRPPGPQIPREADLLNRPEPARTYLLARLDHGWTLADAARRIGIHESSLSRIESNANRPSAVTEARLRDVYGL
jgi:transcriptional regulator with XRE-family HTH domain